MECQGLSICKLLKIENLEVPEYQRPYAWDEEQVDYFFKDLEEFVKTKDSDYYLFGQVIFHHDDATNKHYIVDGQQRIITSFIFLSALRDYIRVNRPHDDPELDSYKAMHRIEEVIGFDESDKPCLRLKASNDGYFQDNILANIKKGTEGFNPKTLSEPKSDSDKKIKNAYENLSKKIDEYVGKSNVEERLRVLTESFLDGFNVSYVEASSTGQASRIFETLNNRGIALSVPDLLRNFLFSRFADGSSSVKEDWTKTMNAIIDEGGNDDDFIKCHWYSLHGYVRANDVFKEIAKMENKKEIKAYFKDLKNSKEAYLKFLNPDNYVKDNTELRKALSNLKIMGIKTHAPLIISMYRKKTGIDDMLKIVKCLESRFIRKHTVMVKNDSGITKSLAEKACEFNKPEYTVKELTDYIVSITPKDNDLIKSFETYKPSSNAITYMILSGIHNNKHRETKIEDPVTVHVEHVMPRNKTKWSVSEEDHTEYLGYLGNQVLLYDKINKSIGNNVYSVKREEYKKSSIDDTRELGEDYDEWGPVQIKDRQSKLCQKFIETWPEDPRPLLDESKKR